MSRSNINKTKSSPMIFAPCRSMSLQNDIFNKRAMTNFVKSTMGQWTLIAQDEDFRLQKFPGPPTIYQISSVHTDCPVLFRDSLEQIIQDYIKLRRKNSPSRIWKGVNPTTFIELGETLRLLNIMVNPIIIAAIFVLCFLSIAMVGLEIPSILRTPLILMMSILFFGPYLRYKKSQLLEDSVPLTSSDRIILFEKMASHLLQPLRFLVSVLYWKRPLLSIFSLIYTSYLLTFASEIGWHISSSHLLLNSSALILLTLHFLYTSWRSLPLHYIRDRRSSSIVSVDSTIREELLSTTASIITNSELLVTESEILEGELTDDVPVDMKPLLLKPSEPICPRIKKVLESDAWSDWKINQQLEGGISVYTKNVPYTQYQAFRFTGSAQGDLFKLARFLAEESNTLKYDALAIDAIRIKDLSAREMLAYSSFKTPVWGISQRDFLLEGTIALFPFAPAHIPAKKGPVLVISLESCGERPEKGEQKGFVRGTVHLFGVIAYYNDEGQLNITYMICIDPKNLPVGTVNSVTMKSQLQKFQKLISLVPTECAQEDADGRGRG